MDETEFVVSTIIHDFMRSKSLIYLLNDFNKELIQNNVSISDTLSLIKFLENVEVYEGLKYIVCQITKKKHFSEYLLSLWITIPNLITFRYPKNWKTDMKDNTPNFILDCDKTSPVYREIYDLHERLVDIAAKNKRMKGQF